MARTKDETLRETTATCLAGIDPRNPPDPATIQADILDAVRLQFEMENAARRKGRTWKIPDRLVPAQIAGILMRLYPIVNIACGGLNADPEYDVLALYQAEGPDKGTYSSSERAIRRSRASYGRSSAPSSGPTCPGTSRPGSTPTRATTAKERCASSCGRSREKEPTRPFPLADFAKDFMLEPLIQASAVIVDENDVGTFIDKAGNLKAIITNDVIQMNRKFKVLIAFQFKGFMVQCLNEMPKIKDKSDSFYRRQLFVPFLKCFTGQERKYIKHDYLHRKDVLEYVLHKVLHMDYYTLSEPEACQLALDEYKEYNDPVRQFASEILPECKWDLLPYTFLYDLYRA